MTMFGGAPDSHVKPTAKEIAKAIDMAAKAVNLGHSVVVKGTKLLVGTPAANSLQFKGFTGNDLAAAEPNMRANFTLSPAVDFNTAEGAKALKDIPSLADGAFGILQNPTVFDGATHPYSDNLSGGKKKGKANKSKAKKGKKGKKGGTRRRKR